MADILTRIRNIWSNMTIVRRAILIGGVALLFVIAGIYIFLSSGEEMAPLYPNVTLSVEEASAIVEQLESMGYVENRTYKISENGAQILVPAEEVDRLRMSMAENSAQPSGGVGYEIFDNTSFGMTEAEHEIAKLRAIRGELVRMISTLDQVQNAKVEVTPAEQSLFASEQKEGSVAVMLSMRPGKTLTEGQIRGIAAAISASVANTPLENITIIDQEGNLLSEFLAEASAGFSGTMLAEKNYAQKQLFEKNLENKVRSMLEDILGRNKVTVNINADMNFDAVERTVVTYDNPELRSLKYEYEVQAGAVGPLGPGPVDINTQYFEDAQTAAGEDTNYHYGEQNNELDTNTTHTIEAPGRIERLNAAVVVDGEFSQAELDTFTNMVQAATGYAQERNDSVYVAAADFDTTYQDGILAEMEAEENRALLWERIFFILQCIGVAGAIGLLLLTFFTLRRRLNRTQDILDEEEAAEMEVYLANQQAMQPISVNEIIDESSRLKPQQEDLTEREIKQFANDSPDKVADIIKTWVLKDEG